MNSELGALMTTVLPTLPIRPTCLPALPAAGNKLKVNRGAEVDSHLRNKVYRHHGLAPIGIYA